jgi:hypothetical protein
MTISDRGEVACESTDAMISDRNGPGDVSPLLNSWSEHGRRVKTCINQSAIILAASLGNYLVGTNQIFAESYWHSVINADKPVKAVGYPKGAPLLLNLDLVHFEALSGIV